MREKSVVKTVKIASWFIWLELRCYEVFFKLKIAFAVCRFWYFHVFHRVECAVHTYLFETNWVECLNQLNLPWWRNNEARKQSSNCQCKRFKLTSFSKWDGEKRKRKRNKRRQAKKKKWAEIASRWVFVLQFFSFFPIPFDSISFRQRVKVCRKRTKRLQPTNLHAHKLNV